MSWLSDTRIHFFINFHKPHAATWFIRWLLNHRPKAFHEWVILVPYDKEATSTGVLEQLRLEFLDISSYSRFVYDYEIIKKFEEISETEMFGGV